MLSSLKKWVQDVTVDLTPTPPPPPRSSPSSSSIPASTHHYFYSTTPFNDQMDSRNSISSAVYISKPVSMDSMRTSRTSNILIPPAPLVSPAEVDLSHLNREEQEHIANVLKRARAVEEQQSPLFPVAVPSTMSPAASLSPSLSSSSTSTDSFTSDKLDKYDNEIPTEAEKSLTLVTIHQCQLCGTIQRENSPICSQCQENETRDARVESNMTFSSHQPTSMKKTFSPLSVTDDDHYDDDRIYDNIVTIDQKTPELNHHQQTDPSINPDLCRPNNLTEIDENDFFYDEPSPYVSAIIAHKSEVQIIPEYKIDEYIDEDDHDERDHVKELEQTIENLSRHLPLEYMQSDSSTFLPRHQIDTNSILEMEIESPTTDEPVSSSHPLTVSIPIKNRRGSLSRSSGVRDHLTDLLIPAIPDSCQSIQRISSTYNKRMFSANRHKRNLPSVPNFLPFNRLQLRRANSESRFTLPAVPSLIIPSSQNLDDESDLLEIDLNNPMGSLTQPLPVKSEYEMHNSIENNPPINTSNDNFTSKLKQLRDQTTNTPPMSNLNSSVKSKRKLKKKDSPTMNSTNEPIASATIQPVTKLQKSTSTEITYPFPTTKLILNPSRHGTSTNLGFRITGGHSIPHCMEVTACIENIDIHHRNYEILKNIVQEGDEVLELGGVSLRGKSVLFVENLMNTIQNEFEIIVRDQSTNINPHPIPVSDTNLQRRHSMDVLKLTPTNSTVIKSKSTSIYSLQQKAKTTITDQPLEEPKSSPTKMLISNEEPTNLLPHRPRSSLLPNDPGLNGARSTTSIERQNSNESDESDTLSQYFQSSQSRTSSSMTTPKSHGRSQSVIPLASEAINASRHLQHLFKSDHTRTARGSTSTERKSSSALASLKFLKKKTKSVDFSSQHHSVINQLRENDYVGDIELQIGHNNEREQLVVRIIQAKNLLPKDTNGFSDPFVKVYLLPGRDQENKRRIKHVSKTLNPVWDHTVLYGHMHREEVQYKKLEFTVWDYDRFKANDFLGQVTIDLKNPNVIDDKPHWYRLQALRSREETANRGSSPRLFKMISVESATSSTSIGNKNSVQMPSRTSSQK